MKASEYLGWDAVNLDTHGHWKCRPMLQQGQLMNQSSPELVCDHASINIRTKSEHMNLLTFHRLPDGCLWASHGKVGKTACDVYHYRSSDHSALSYSIRGVVSQRVTLLCSHLTNELFVYLNMYGHTTS